MGYVAYSRSLVFQDCQNRVNTIERARLERSIITPNAHVFCFPRSKFRESHLVAHASFLQAGSQTVYRMSGSRETNVMYTHSSRGAAFLVSASALCHLHLE
jgi:hypothetical protein